VDAPFPEGLVEDAASVLEDDAVRPWGLNYYGDVFDSDLFFPLQRQKELAWMMERAREVWPITVMEIGADKGGGLYHWVKCLPTVRNVIACEIRGTPYSSLFEKVFPEHRFMWMPHCSRNPDTRPMIMSLMGSIDCLFIDGDKSAFEQDFDHYLPLLSPNARVFMHDVTDDAPGQAFNRVSARPGWKGEVFIDRSDSIAAMGREKKGLPPMNPHEGWLRHWKGRSCGVGMLRRGAP
jgi:hypothetical protein